MIGYNLAFTFVASNIDVWGHLGGLLAGIVLGWGLMPRYAVAITELGPSLIDMNLPGRWSMVVIGAVALLLAGTWMVIALQAPSI